MAEREYKTPPLELDRVLWYLVRIRRDALRREYRRDSRWSIVADLLAIGSTSAVDTCLRYGVDPFATSQAQEDRAREAERQAIREQMAQREGVANA